MALGARDRTHRRLHHDEGVGRVGKAVVLGDESELQLETGGHAGLSYGRTDDGTIRGRIGR